MRGGSVPDVIPDVCAPPAAAAVSPVAVTDLPSQNNAVNNDNQTTASDHTCEITEVLPQPACMPTSHYYVHVSITFISPFFTLYQRSFSKFNL